MYLHLICVALLALLTIGLGFGVSVQRAKTRTVYGCNDQPDDPLYKYSRAHGNAAEFAPLLAILIYILGQAPYAPWIGWMMVIATVARYMHAIGIIFGETMAKPHPLRFLGALLTYISGIALSIALLIRAL